MFDFNILTFTWLLSQCHIFFFSFYRVMDSQTSQEQRAFLRERFLRMLASISGSPLEVSMQEKTNVKCNFSAADVDFHHVHINRLATPMGVLPHATLRTSDIHVLNFPSVNLDKKL